MKESTFMREYYREKYEDPVWIVENRNSEYQVVYEEKRKKESLFTEKLKEKCPELLSLYDEVVECYLAREDILFEEFYILGAQDRERSLQPQK